MLWIQRDPLGRLPGDNEYAYCLGEPVDRYDPYGLWDWDNDWVETALHLVLPTEQGDAAREGFVQGAKDGATMAADNLTYGLNDDLHQAAETIREENAGDWTYEVGDGASVIAREAAIAAATMGAGQAVAATRVGAAIGSAIASSQTALRTAQALTSAAKIYAAGQSGYNVGNGIYNISIGNYYQGTLQIGNGGLGLISLSSAPKGAKGAGKGGERPPPPVCGGKNRSNRDLVQEVATRAEKAAARKGITGRPADVGTWKHDRARRVLDRYQDMHGNRGLITEQSWKNHAPVRYGEHGSVRLDVYDAKTLEVWDYKFGRTGLSPSRIRQIIGNGPIGIPSVTEIRP
jgi:hypothetical protein